MKASELKTGQVQELQEGVYGSVETNYGDVIEFSKPHLEKFVPDHLEMYVQDENNDDVSVMVDVKTAKEMIDILSAFVSKQTTK